MCAPVRKRWPTTCPNGRVDPASPVVIQQPLVRMCRRSRRPRAFAFLAIAAASISHAFAISVTDLRCDDQLSPLGAAPEPVLTWRVTTEERNQRQSAWQVLVASDKTKLEEGIADLWDSGKTTATREPGVRYAGKPLSVGNRCHWKVRCWDASGKVSSWSDPADFEVARSSSICFCASLRSSSRRPPISTDRGDAKQSC